jgi:hypothetical protein
MVLRVDRVGGEIRLTQSIRRPIVIYCDGERGIFNRRDRVRVALNHTFSFRGRYRSRSPTFDH